MLSAYDYDIKCKSTDAHANADSLSRLPLQSTSDQQLNEKVPISVFNVSQISALPVTCQDIQRATRTDRLLSQIYNYVKNGWFRNVNEELKPYFLKKKNEIGLESGRLLWGIRVIIPIKLQSRILQSLHANHPGISRMKAIARSYYPHAQASRVIGRAKRDPP